MAVKPRESSQPLTLRGDIEDWADDDSPKTGRQKVAIILDHVAVQTAIVVTVLVEVLLLTSLLLIDLGVIQTPSSNNFQAERNDTLQRNTSSNSASQDSDVLPVDQAESAMHVLNLLILSIFLMEVVLRLAVHKKTILKDRWQIYDIVVVGVTFSLYVALTAASVRRTVTYSVGFTIILRLWRIGRIYEGITQPIKRKAERVINSHRKARKLADDQLQAAHEALDKRRREVAILKQHILSLHPSSFNSDMGSISRLSAEGYELSEAMKQRSLQMCDTSPDTLRGSVPSVSPASTISHHDSIDTVIEVTGVNLDLKHRRTDSNGVRIVRHPDSSMPYDDDIGSRFGEDALDRDLDSDNDTIRACSERSSTSGGSTIKASDYMDSISDHVGEGSEMDFSEDVIKELTSKDMDREIEGRPPLDEKDSGKGDSFRNEKQDLIPGTRCKDNYAYSNAGFSETDVHDLTQEEISEIERVAQVPFMYGSTSRIHQEGIPMTDL